MHRRSDAGNRASARHCRGSTSTRDHTTSTKSDPTNLREEFRAMPENAACPGRRRGSPHCRTAPSGQRPAGASLVSSRRRWSRIRSMGPPWSLHFAQMCAHRWLAGVARPWTRNVGPRTAGARNSEHPAPPNRDAAGLASHSPSSPRHAIGAVGQSIGRSRQAAPRSPKLDSSPALASSTRRVRLGRRRGGVKRQQALAGIEISACGRTPIHSPIATAGAVTMTRNAIAAGDIPG